MRPIFVLLAIAAIAAAEPSVTIYNQRFGVVRESIHLDLQQGVNQVTFNDTTAHLEPDSVMLRDPAGKANIRILEQNYRADQLSPELLLKLNEGKVIDFIIQNGDQRDIVQGRVVRSNYAPHSAAAMQRYGQQYQMMQQAYAYGGGASQPIIEIYGKLHFGLPGQPLFPAIPDDTILKPALTWTLESDTAGAIDAEIGYLTGGMSWESSYNLVAPKEGDKVDLVGWVTMDNQSGKTFENAQIKLMAGNVSKIQPQNRMMDEFQVTMGGMSESRVGPTVTENAFDEYHLYTVERAVTLRDRETKQVEFVRADGITSTRFYVYDGAKIDPNQYRGWGTEQLMQQRDYGTQSNKLVWVMREFANTKENGLGIPLPAGKTRFYQRDEAAPEVGSGGASSGQLEFTGENVIAHTPQGETVRVYTGDAFDLVGERKQVSYSVDYNAHWVDEMFEIKLRNRKKEAAEIRVVEHLYRGANFEIRSPSMQFEKTDAQTIEFRVQLQPDEEKKVTYLVHYTW
ncbi:MAG: DUF4139 domain-containing protein [Candidatus Hydrogenedentes bacterium]|nr:DUF4139 domain-containing protein [Candidatus Hydrogenedentota bacterium]